MWREPVAISLGAVIGALMRYYLNLWFVKILGNAFPFGILFINLTGCLLIGFLATLLSEKIINISIELKLLTIVGFLGSYTTFSTYSLDTYLLLQKGSFILAFGYWIGTATLGIISTYLGVILAKYLLIKFN
jgi:fluoride exporter